MMKIKPKAIDATCDRKTMMFEGQKNTFGLLPGTPACGGTCEGATCEKGGCFYTAPGRKLPTCYVYSKMAFRPAIKALLQRNTELLANADSDEQKALFRSEFARFLNADIKKGVETHMYRIHWSGDCIDTRYTANLRQVMLEFPDIQFWGYSRNLFTVPIMLGVENCAWYVSMDKVNVKKQLAFLTRRGLIASPGCSVTPSNINFCYMAEQDDIGRPMFSCPTDDGKQPFVGACARCMNCVTGRNPVYFKTK